MHDGWKAWSSPPARLDPPSQPKFCAPRPRRRSAPSFLPILRKQPSVESLDRLLLVLPPPLRVRLQQQLEVVGRRREIFGALLGNVVVSPGIGGAVGQERGELGLPLRIGAELDELLPELHFGIALRDHPSFQRVNTLIP